MEKLDRVSGVAVPFGRSNVDTDLIIPGTYLKTVSRRGLGAGAFLAVRQEDPENVFDTPRNNRAPILIAGANFGCGSSREHAAWALADMGFRVIIAPSFADIFASNAFKNGLLLVALPTEAVERLLEAAATNEISVDLQAQQVVLPSGESFAFEIDSFRKECLLNGLDEIDLTLALEAEISDFETRLALTRPWALQASG
jgi:3-isopropylmalate/(R)-2-methylmalate dehydratase small subunit